MARTTHAAGPGSDETTERIFDRIVDRLRQLREVTRDGNGTAGGDGTILGQPIVIPDPPSELHATDHRFAGFDLRSVAAFSTRFYGCVAAMVLVGAIALWLMASVLGLVSAFEDFMDGIGFTGFRLLSLPFLFGLALLSAAIAAFMVGITVVAAGLYNVLASRWGGVRIFVSETTGVAPTVDLTGAHISNQNASPDGNGTANGNGSPNENGSPNGKASRNGDGTPKVARFPRRVSARRVAKPVGARWVRPPRNGSNPA